MDYNGVPAIIKGFAKKDNCDPTPEVTQASNFCTKTHYKNGDCGTEVILYSVKNRWHEYKNDYDDFQTSKALWDFFRKYSNKCGETQEVNDTLCEESAKKNIYEVECSSDYVASHETVSQMSGTGVLSLKEATDYVNINIPLEEKGAYKVYVGYNSIYGFKEINCTVNGESNTIKLGNTSDDKSEDKQGETLVGSFLFSEGDNDVRLTPIWTWAVVDYVRIEKIENTSACVSEANDDKGNFNCLYKRKDETLYIKTKEEGTIRITDLNGMLIYTSRIAAEENIIRLDKLPKGIYIVYFRGLTMKIVK